MNYMKFNDGGNIEAMMAAMGGQQGGQGGQGELRTIQGQSTSEVQEDEEGRQFVMYETPEGDTVKVFGDWESYGEIMAPGGGGVAPGDQRFIADREFPVMANPETGEYELDVEAMETEMYSEPEREMAEQAAPGGPGASGMEALMESLTDAKGPRPGRAPAMGGQGASPTEDLLEQLMDKGQRRGGGMVKYGNGGSFNGGPVPEASADPLKSPSVQASVENLLAPYRDQINYLRQERSKRGSNDPAVRGLGSQTRSAFSALEGAGQGDVDVIRELISMKPTTREEAKQRAKAVEFAQSVSDDYARKMGTPIKNPLYNFFGLEDGPIYGKGGVVKYRSGGMVKYGNGGRLSRDERRKARQERRDGRQIKSDYSDLGWGKGGVRSLPPRSLRGQEMFPEFGNGGRPSREERRLGRQMKRAYAKSGGSTNAVLNLLGRYGK